MVKILRRSCWRFVTLFASCIRKQSTSTRSKGMGRFTRSALNWSTTFRWRLTTRTSWLTWKIWSIRYRNLHSLVFSANLRKWWHGCSSSLNYKLKSPRRIWGPFIWLPKCFKICFKGSRRRKNESEPTGTVSRNHLPTARTLSQVISPNFNRKLKAWKLTRLYSSRRKPTNVILSNNC
jgi:hypothetical protein